MAYVHEVQTVYDVVQNHQIILLCEKAHGDSARCEQIRMLLPQRSQGGTLKNHMLLIANCIAAHAAMSQHYEIWLQFVMIVYYIFSKSLCQF